MAGVQRDAGGEQELQMGEGRAMCTLDGQAMLCDAGHGRFGGLAKQSKLTGIRSDWSVQRRGDFYEGEAARGALGGMMRLKAAPEGLRGQQWRLDRGGSHHERAARIL